VTSSKDRQRAAARAKLEREMSVRQEQAARRRHRRTWSAASAIAVVVVVGLVVIIINASSGGKPKGKPAAAASAAAAFATCKWTPNPNPSASPSPSASIAPNKDLVKTGTPPTTDIPNKGTKTMTLASNLGTITVSLDLAKAPCASESMTYLASKKFFDNTTCGNLIASGPYVLMCGDPSGKGDGGPNYSYATENLPTTQRPNYQQGDVAMLNNGSGNGSQFMFIYKDTPVSTDPSTGTETPAIPSQFTIIGTVTSGMDVVQKVAASGAGKTDANGGNPPKLPIKFTSVTVASPSAP
jgi:peptidyl-prolyl cis-trans isomerase B (cyclophilin B)